MRFVHTRVGFPCHLAGGTAGIRAATCAGIAAYRSGFTGTQFEEQAMVAVGGLPMLVETDRTEETSRRAVELCYRLAFLEGRRLAGMPLNLGEASQLAALAPLLGGEPRGRRRHLRMAVAIRASARAPAGAGEAGGMLVLNISAGGIFAACSAPPPPGSAIQVRLAGDERVEYSFPCVVQWTSARGMGLRFVGIPLELRRGGPAPS